MKKAVIIGAVLLAFAFVASINYDPKVITSSSDKHPQNQTVKAVEKPAPKIDFTGNVEPSIARPGEKVIITFEIENLDKERTIDGMRILFTSGDFINKGLTITEVMSGGKQDGTAFQWKNELMKIKPGEKRIFTIIAVAKNPGSYETVVVFKSPYGAEIFDNQDQELKAKLVVY